MNSTNFAKIDQFLTERDFNKIEDYSKNKRHMLGVFKSLKKADPEQIKELLPKFNRALKGLRETQDTIREHKLQPQKKDLKDFLEKTKHQIKHTWYGSPKLGTLIKHLNRLVEEKNILGGPATERTKRFQQVSSKLKSLAKGTTKPGAKILSEEYWQETIGLNLQIDGKPFKGRMYMGFFAVEPGHGRPYLDQWKEHVDEDGVPFQTKYSFEDFMNRVKIPQMGAEEKKALLTACESVVEYYDKKELDHLRVGFTPDGKIVMPSTMLNTWVDLWNKKGIKHSFRPFLEQQPAIEMNPAPLANLNDKFMYVLTEDGSLYMQIKQRGKANHTSLSGGHAVLAAGHIGVREGKIVSIDTFSGHYKPTKKQIITMLEYLLSQGVNVDDIHVSYSDDTNGSDFDQKKPGEIKTWLASEKAALIKRLEKFSDSIDQVKAKKMPYTHLEKLVNNLEERKAA